MQPPGKERSAVRQFTLALMLLKTLESLGLLHGYGTARRFDQIGRDRLFLNHGTLYPVLLELEQGGSITPAWGVSEHYRKTKLYRLARAGSKLLESQTRPWRQTTEITARFFALRQE
jgi:DNA-binding PadR family transcriptional regulator